MNNPTLDKLKTQRDQLNARIQKLEATQRAREKKQNTRRKILVGAYFLDKAKAAGTMDEIKNAMHEFLTRQSDRELFGLSENDQ